jgi:hypothetical protein
MPTPRSSAKPLQEFVHFCRCNAAMDFFADAEIRALHAFILAKPARHAN